MTGQPDQQEPVLCIDCDRPVHTPQARARRIGAKCWRRRRAEDRKREAAMAPTLPTMPMPRRAAQSGEALFNHPHEHQEEVRTDG
ncbi:hypothetical protein ACN27G_06135 [Plantactinospora sp. WMMB334]|uniref:hypothetical protein n=1 Tax=Plantactinospora sp. WMMB334 TaxID=3404119 RepID=UPI003B933BCE